MKAYIVKGNLLSDDDFVSITILQGLVNKYISLTNELLYLDVDNYIDYLDKNLNCEYLSFDECIKYFKSYIKGIIAYDFNSRGSQINVATNYASYYNAIIADKNRVDYYRSLGLEVLYDVTKLSGDYIDIQRACFLELKDKLKKGGIVHQISNMNRYNLCLRDFAVCNSWFCLTTEDDLKSRELLKDVLLWSGPLTPIYGWTTNEVSFVNYISRYGSYIIPSDWSSNLSVLPSFRCDIKNVVVNSKLERSNKYHYLAIEVSDGDNIQWLQRDFLYNSIFKGRIDDLLTYPLAFTISPMLESLSPVVLNRIYSSGIKNEFIAGVSGIGYMNPCNYPKIYLDAFVIKTAEAMRRSNMNIVTLLDNLANIDNIYDVINKYAKSPDINGGIYMLDPDKYEGGKGKIFFSDNHKPFISVRYSLWAPGNDRRNVNDEYIQQMADKINALPANIYSENGYTVLNVHPWDIDIKDLDNLISRLDNHIKIVPIAKLIRMVKENIKEDY